MSNFKLVMRALNPFAEYSRKRQATEERKVWLVHGLVEEEPGKFKMYAWLETKRVVTEFFEKNGVDFVLTRPREDFYSEREPTMVIRYNPNEAMLLKEVTESDGPWSLELQYRLIMSRIKIDSELPH